MKKLLSVIATIAVAVAVGFLMFAPAPIAYAEDDTHKCTNLINVGDCDDVGEDDIWSIINVFVAIITAGLIIAGTIGIIYCGYLVLTARDDTTKVEKAKKRLADIVIGLMAVVIFGGLISWFLPGGIPSAAEIKTPTVAANVPEESGSRPEAGDDDPTPESGDDDASEVLVQGADSTGGEGEL